MYWVLDPVFVCIACILFFLFFFKIICKSLLLLKSLSINVINCIKNYVWHKCYSINAGCKWNVYLCLIWYDCVMFINKNVVNILFFARRLRQFSVVLIMSSTIPLTILSLDTWNCQELKYIILKRPTNSINWRTIRYYFKAHEILYNNKENELYLSILYIKVYFK